MKVKIQLECMTTYSTTREMSESDYYRLLHAMEEGGREEVRSAENELSEMMTPQDITGEYVEDVMNFLPVKEPAAE